MTDTQAEGLPTTALDAARDEAAKDTPILTWPTGAHAKVAYVQHHVTEVGKSGYNQHFRFNYIQEHGVIEVLRPLLRDMKLVVIASPAEEVVQFDAPGTKQPVGRQLRGKLTVWDTELPMDHPSAKLEAWYTADGADASDKAGTKAQTMWTKYALQKLFLVPTEGIDDTDATSGEGNAAQGQAPAPAAAQAAPAQPPAPGVEAGVGGIGPERAQKLLEIIGSAVNAGQLDRNKAVAKLATYRVPLDVEGVGKLSEGQAEEYFSWCNDQINAAAKA